MTLNKFNNYLCKSLIILFLSLSYLFLASSIYGAIDGRPDGEVRLTKSATANNELGFSLFPLLSQKNSNFVLSPLGVNASLIPTALGSPSGSPTRSQILKALSLDGGISFQEYSEHFRTYSTISGVKTALLFNKITVSPRYKSFLEKNLPYTVQQLSGGVDSINSWAKSQSNGKVDNMVDFLSPNSQFVLLNISQFSPKLNDSVGFQKLEKRPFSTEKVDNKNNNDQISLWFVAGVSFLPTVHRDGFKAILFPLSVNVESPPAKGAGKAGGDLEGKASETNQQLRMCFIVPDNTQVMSKIIDGFDDRFFNELHEEFILANPQQVAFYIPQFKMNSSIDLLPYLQSLGINHAFDHATSDFSLLSSSSLHICKVSHRSVVEFGMDDDSSVHPSASFGIMGLSGKAFLTKIAAKINGGNKTQNISVTHAESSVFSIPEFCIDKPFIFIVYDYKTKTILFLGKVSNPNVPLSI